jgi:PAS domain S-box-containing protein
MKWSLERKAIIGLLAGLCILMVVAVFAYHSTIQFLQVTEQRAQTHLVLEKVENLLTLITDTETGARGYIVTGKKRFLEPYQNAVAVLNHSRSELRTFLRDIPEQVEQLEQVDTVIDRYLTLADQQIQLRHNRHFDESLKELYMDAEKEFTDHIRIASATMKAAAAARLFAQDREVLASSRHTMAAIVVGSILASGIALCAVIIIRRDPHSGKRAELDRLDRTPGSYVDITRHTETEEALKLSRAFAQNVIASSLDMIIVVDKDRRILEFNRAAQDAFGHRPDDVLGHAFDMLYLDERLGNHIYATVLEQGRYVSEVRARRKDGSDFVSLLSASVLKNETGDILGVMSVSRDVTEQKQAEAELRKAKEAAESANQAKTEFLASMSHEIRTPMNAIIGMADLLWETPLMPEQQEYVGIFRRAGLSLLTLLNDILDLSKVEAGYVELERIEFDLHEVVDKTAEMMALRAHEKGLELGCSVAPGVATDLIGDPNRLRQVLLNLLGNAIKFTDKGEVVLRVIQEPVGDQPGALQFAISDTGIGIPAEKLPCIFGRFVQADASTTRKYGGTGLGLAISKRLVALMGGRIWVTSTEGVGSTFAFTARFDLQGSTRSDPLAGVINLSGIKALVADDNDNNRMILNEALSSWGAVVTEVSGGNAALLELKSQTTEPYQLVLLDCCMPDLSGFKVIEQFAAVSTLEGMTVMALTSDNRSADIAKSYKLGLGGYLVKPIRRSDLYKSLTIAMSRPNGLGSTTWPETALEQKGTLKILLVEDSADNALLIHSYLKKSPYEIEHVENGKAAVDRFQTGQYDLVLMDMHMPVMDGYTATKQIRHWERQQGRPPIPILALTAYGMREEEQKSLQVGCTAHLLKPIRKPILLEAIARHAKERASE